MKKMFIEIRLCNRVTYIFKGHVKILKIYMVKFNVSILNRLKIMFFFVNTKYIHTHNVIFNSRFKTQVCRLQVPGVRFDLIACFAQFSSDFLLLQFFLWSIPIFFMLSQYLHYLLKFLPGILCEDWCKVMSFLIDLALNNYFGTLLLLPFCQKHTLTWYIICWEASQILFSTNAAV